MTEKIKLHFQKIFEILLEDGKIIIPKERATKLWKKTLNDWISDDEMILFVRKGSERRGQIFETSCGRKIMTTDNTPAHWVFKSIVFNEIEHNKNFIHDLIINNNFPISFIRKRSEINTLIGKMVADKETRLNIENWKLAHIDRIVMKRGNNITVEDYKQHHNKFLDLSNMYLIDKSLSGLAETQLFNEIIKEYISKTGTGYNI